MNENDNLDKLTIEILKRLRQGRQVTPTSLDIDNKILNEKLCEMKDLELITFREFGNKNTPQFEHDPVNIEIKEEGLKLEKEYRK